MQAGLQAFHACMHGCMLACMLPACVAACHGLALCVDDYTWVVCLADFLQELGLIGLRIQRMPNEMGVEFNNPATYPYLSVASPSCHDVSPLRAW